MIQRVDVGSLVVARTEVVCIARYEVLKSCRKAGLKFVAIRGAVLLAARIITCDTAPPAEILQHMLLRKACRLASAFSSGQSLCAYKKSQCKGSLSGSDIRRGLLPRLIPPGYHRTESRTCSECTESRFGRKHMGCGVTCAGSFTRFGLTVICAVRVVLQIWNRTGLPRYADALSD
jgi:hypothetical protein